MADDRVYLSHVIETEKFKKGQANIVVAPCHSGKTTAAVSKIAPLASGSEKVLFLIDTTAGRDALAGDKENEIKKYSDRWLKDISVEWWGESPSGKGIRVMTYHQFGYHVKDNSQFLKDVEVLVCDEMHNLIKYMGIEYGKNKSENLLGTSNELNTCKTAMKEIQRVCHLTDGVPLVIIMTATVNPVSQNFHKKGVPTEYFYYYGKVSEDKTEQTLYYGNLEQAIRNIELGQRTIVYIPTITMMKTYAEIAEENWNSVCCLWGTNNKSHPLSKEQEEVRNAILKNKRIPEWVDVLFINAAYETSINIINEDFKTMIVHSGNEDVQIQARGRLRHDIDKLYVYDSSKENIVFYFPEQYYDKELYSDDIDKIVDNLDLHDDKGRPIGWRKIKAVLQKNGVIASKIKKNNKAVWMLHKA